MLRNFKNVSDETRLFEVQRLTAHVERDSDEVLNRIVAMVADHFEAPMSLVSIIHRDYQVFKAAVGFDQECTRLSESLCIHGLNERVLWEVCDTAKDQRFVDNPSVHTLAPIRYYAGAPLITQRGAILGALCILDKKTREPMCTKDGEFLKNAAAVVVARLESIYQKLFYDPLTGLPNRKHFEMDVREHSSDTLTRLAILVEPLPAAGMDALVKALGLDCFMEFMLGVRDILTEVLPKNATLYRASSLSYAILIVEDSDTRLPDLIKRVNSALAKPVHCRNVPVFTDAGIGVITLRPKLPFPVDSLRLMASVTDTARRSEKRWLFYDSSIDARSQRSAVLLHAIETALLSPDQLSLVFQPRVNLANNVCVSAEALLRWCHPTLGEIGPAEFIGLAETTAAIRHITSWVVRNVCKQVAEWRVMGHEITVSLNISALDLTDGRFMDELTTSLAGLSLPPQCIELEFTESALITDFKAVQQQLMRINKAGISISIDDFGSGYSNWRYLRDIPAKGVKLDRSLLTDLKPGNSNWHIVKGIIDLAKNLKLSVVAEGIETVEQYRQLLAWQCPQGQGFFFSKPLAPREFILWLDASATRDYRE